VYQAIVHGSAADDAVCCDDDEGSVSVMACAVQVRRTLSDTSINPLFLCIVTRLVQNIELLRAVCSCKNKAVQVKADVVANAAVVEMLRWWKCCGGGNAAVVEMLRWWKCCGGGKC
jgi:hypothetical protein